MVTSPVIYATNIFWKQNMKKKLQYFSAKRRFRYYQFHQFEIETYELPACRDLYMNCEPSSS